MSSERKRDKDKFVMEWLKNSAFLLLWILLFCAALFNVGYFLTLDLKYISFLSISDYYAGTMVNIGLMALVIVWLFFSFNIRTKNIWAKSGEDFLFWAKNIIRLLKSRFYLMREEKQLKKMSCKFQECGTKKQTQEWMKQNKKLENRILYIKNEIITLRKTAVKNIFNLFKVLVFISVVSFFVFYDIYILCGLKPVILMVVLFVGGLWVDSLISNMQARKIVLSIIVAVFVTASGYSMLVRDLQRRNIQVCVETDCYYLVRKIENGYFVTNKTEFMFLDNELHIKTRQSLHN